jgi:hypothetical protein
VHNVFYIPVKIAHSRDLQKGPFASTFTIDEREKERDFERNRVVQGPVKATTIKPTTAEKTKAKKHVTLFWETENTKGKKYHQQNKPTDTWNQDCV